MSITVKFWTNLDISTCEVFPTTLPCRPMVGDKVYSSWKKDCTAFHLEVVSVTTLYSEYLSVELGIPKTWQGSLGDWIKNYRRYRLREFD